MSRQSQDIPIRPRYGIPPEALEDDRPETLNTNPGSNGADKVASSYSEIPFLAQYPGPVPDTVPENVAAAVPNPASQSFNNEPDGDSSLEEDYDESPENEEDHSKNSSCPDSKTPKRPKSLQCDSCFPYELEDEHSTEEGTMRHFVAEHLEDELRGASPLNKKLDQFGFVSQSSTPSTSMGGNMLTRHFLQTQLPQIDANVLSDIEIEAQYLAASVDNLTENLCNLLHSISSITADNVEVHKNAVNKLTDSMDANIKCMYTIMAKTEEITKSMKPTEQLGQKIREIKRLVDMLDNTM